MSIGKGARPVSDPHKIFEIRCPVHGFIPITDWERDIINRPAFQRLRRIRQLAWTDQVYPGAMHTRFEHSLGVMHVATMLFDSIVKRSGVRTRWLVYQLGKLLGRKACIAIRVCGSGWARVVGRKRRAGIELVRSAPGNQLRFKGGELRSFEPQGRRKFGP